MNIGWYFIWIGNPNNCLRLYRRPQALFLFEKQHAILKNVCFKRELLICGVSSYLGKHQIDAERNPVPKNGRFSS